MTPASILLFAGALVVAAGAPGPSVAALVARVIARGIRDVVPFLIALWIGEGIWLSLAVFGLAWVAETFHLVFTAIRYAGVAYLLYLAWTMWTAPLVTREDHVPQTRSPWRLFMVGLGVCLGNPKVMMFYLALLPTIIDLGSVTVVGWLELTLTMFAVLMAIDLTWATAALHARRLLRSPRAMRIANRAGATAMAGAAAAIAMR